MKFIDAVIYLSKLEHINDLKNDFLENKCNKIDNQDYIKLQLPKKNQNNDRVISYLKSRGICEDIIIKCIEQDLIYEDVNHNVIFVGYDEQHRPRYAGARATNNTRFMHDITGSNKAYSFTLESINKNNQIHIFEGAIDLLSFASLLLLNNVDYENYTLISLAGVYQPAKVIEQSKIPRAVERYLLNNENITEIVLHFDNDIAGQNATIAFQKVIPKRYKIINEPSPYGKDINDYLKKYLGIKNNNKEREIIMKRYMFNIKKEVRNNFIIDAKDEEIAKKIFQLICDKTDILDRFLDEELNNDVSYERNFYEICEYNNDDNHQVNDKVEDKVTKK